jgi:hypothetical protein
LDLPSTNTPADVCSVTGISLMAQHQPTAPFSP